MAVDDPLFFEDLPVGSVWESSSRLVTEHDVLQFADISGDHNPIHVDPEFAKTTPFRRTIAHGLLGLSIAGGLSTVGPPVRTVALTSIRQWQFLLPVFPGDVLRLRNTVLEKELRPNGKRGQIVWLMQMVNQNDKIVHEGTIETIVETTLAAKTRNSRSLRNAG